jgi:flavin-dependent dehydrogenase
MRRHAGVRGDARPPNRRDARIGAQMERARRIVEPPSRRRLLGDATVLLVGDAAGLALAPSGEGILAAVESGLLAADAILRAT